MWASVGPPDLERRALENTSRQRDMRNYIRLSDEICARNSGGASKLTGGS